MSGWAGTTFGNGWMHKWLCRFIRIFGVRCLYAFTAVFILPWCLIFSGSRHWSYVFYSVTLGYGRLKAARFVWRNHYRFAQCVIDKFAMYAGKKFDVTIERNEEFVRRAEGPDGFLLLSSHIGNYEIAGYTLVSDRKAINAVVFDGEKASVMTNRGNMFSRTNINMIALKPDMSHLFEMDKALSEGGIVSIPADRYSAGNRRIRLGLLGAEADFPAGAFNMTAMRSLDALAVNVMKTGALRYTIYVTPLPYDKSATRKEQVRSIAGAYVAELERLVRKYPEQWFNFYDFWS